MYVAPVLVVNTLLQLFVHAALAPLLEYVALTPVYEYVALVPAVVFVMPAQRFLAAYTMAVVKAGVNLDLTGVVSPTCLPGDPSLGGSTVFHCCC